MLNLSKFVSLAFKFQILDLSKFVSLACCCKMQAHSTMRGKSPKIIDVDFLSDVSSPKCHSPKSPRIKELGSSRTLFVCLGGGFVVRSVEALLQLTRTGIPLQIS